MNPIDQIRKALANVADALKTAQRGVVYAHENAASKHLEAEYEAVLNTIADATAQLAEARSSMDALRASHDAAVQRAAEMQERCAQEVERVGPHDGPPALITAGFAAAIRAIKE